MTPEETREHAKGLAFTAAAFLLWGLSPIFWKLLDHVPARELLAHRIAWSALMMLAIVGFRGRLREALRELHPDRALWSLLASTTLIAVNWLLYIWAVTTDRILEASLGYFVNPLISVLLGLVVLRERLSRGQWLSVSLAAGGVLVLVLRTGSVPLLSLGLATTFGLYGLLRKTVRAGAAEGLAVETGLLAPWTAAWLVLHRDEGAFGSVGAGTDLLLVGTGVMTFLPLLWFAHGARRIPLSSVGLLQYLAPTGQFCLAVFVYGEPFDPSRGLAFALIWTALVVYTVDARKRWRRNRTASDPGSSPRHGDPGAEDPPGSGPGTGASS